MSHQLDEFFAVTSTSVYRVFDRDEQHNNHPTAQKIALRGESSVGVSGYLNNGTHIAIGNCLIAYIPEGGGLTSFERRIESVNTRWWGGHSSPIVALFKTEAEAIACFEQDNLKFCDPRWEKETREVLAAIGDDHPSFYICRHPGLCLTFAS